jgi:hypothetical protein
MKGRERIIAPLTPRKASQIVTKESLNNSSGFKWSCRCLMEDISDFPP